MRSEVSASSPASIRAGYRSARAVTRHHAKSFWFASHALFGARRRGAFALYAFCRRLDDVVDAPGADRAALPARLDHARALIRNLYRPAENLPWPAWPEGELAALRHTVQRFEVPEQPLHDLVAGMEMDLSKHRYADANELDLYCYRVAGTVGLMMAPLLGCDDPRALTAAAELGHAMQLTNILRDVGEDLARGRIYLPADSLAAYDLTEADLQRGTVDARWRALMGAQIARARGLYAQGFAGLCALRGFGAQTMVRVMAAVYGGILAAIERAEFDVFTRRVHVPLSGKLRLAGRALITGAR